MFATKTTLGLLLTFGLFNVATPAQAGDPIKVEAESLPLPLHREGASPADPIQIDAKVEASAVEPIGDGKYVLVSHDKASEFYVVETATGRLVGPAVTSPALPQTSASGPKFEGMARDSKGNFYAVGSHSGKTDEERSQRAHLVRYRFQTLVPGQAPTIDPASVVKFDAWASLKSALAAESNEVAKLKIEGLAIKEVPSQKKTEVYIGLREPSDLVRVFVADLADNATAGTSLSFRMLFAFDAGTSEGVQATLTSLLYVPAWEGFFVLTATEDKDNAFHGNTLWFVPESSIPSTGVAKAQRVHNFEVAMKAEGLADLPVVSPSKTSLRLFVAFDNDAKSTHMPSRVQTFRLSR